jgi:beta-lactam-binding protein with PASTA domain
MAKPIEDQLRELIGDPQAAAGLADVAQAAALARQEQSFRQRAGAAAARLRRAKAAGDDPKEIATLETRAKARTERLDVAHYQAETADAARPLPDKDLAQVYGRTTGTAGTPPLTAAALTKDGEVLASAAVDDRGLFHLTHRGALEAVLFQISDAKDQVLYRSLDPVDVAASGVLYIDVPLSPPKPTPGPVPSQVKMPDLVGQSEAYAVALLARLGRDDAKVTDKKGDGIPDIVIDQSPKAGTALTKDSKIALTVRRSKSGPGPNTLPYLIGLKIEAAKETLKELGLAAKVETRPHDGTAGLVLEQTPEARTSLEGVKTVVLTASVAEATAPKTALVPDLTGKARADALEILKALGLKGAVDDIAKSDQPEGVVGQLPEPGKAVAVGSTVAITVNSKSAVEPPRVAVPGVVGLAKAEAARPLKAVELRSSYRNAASDAKKGQVIAQDPAADARVAPGSEVALTLSTGPKERTTGPRDLSVLIRDMSRTERARRARLGTDDIKAAMATGGVTSVAAARTLAAMPVAEVQASLRLRNLRVAASFRMALRDVLKDAD